MINIQPTFKMHELFYNKIYIKMVITKIKKLKTICDRKN